MIKVCVLGDSGVGKTSLIDRLSGSEFELMYTPTTEIYNTEINFNEHKFNLEEHPSSKVFNFIGTYDMAIIMFDTTSRNSYKNVNFWVAKFLTANKDKKYIIVGNKIDNVKDAEIIEGYFKGISVKDNIKCFDILEEILNKISDKRISE